MELCGLKGTSKGSGVPVTKTVGKGNRNALDELNADEATLFQQTASTGLYLSIDRPSLPDAMIELMGGTQEFLTNRLSFGMQWDGFVTRTLLCYPATKTACSC